VFRRTESSIIELELMKEFKRASDGHFTYKREFEFQGKKYLKVSVSGIKQGSMAQYGIEIQCTYGTFRGEVKRSSVFIKVDVEPTPKNILECLNRILAIYNLIRALTVIPSDCGIVDTLEIHFTRIDGDYHEKVVRVPLR